VEKISSKPTARVRLSEKPAEPERIPNMLKGCKPVLPTTDWQILKVEEAESARRWVILSLNKESVTG